MSKPKKTKRRRGKEKKKQGKEDIKDVFKKINELANKEPKERREGPCGGCDLLIEERRKGLKLQ